MTSVTTDRGLVVFGTRDKTPGETVRGVPNPRASDRLHERTTAIVTRLPCKRVRFRGPGGPQICPIRWGRGGSGSDRGTRRGWLMCGTGQVIK